jgi:putative transposase
MTVLRPGYKDILIEYKEFTENKVTWLEGKNAIELYNDKFVLDKINYIHNNPVESGLVRCPHEWIYSSATNYQELESIIEVETLTQRLETIK